MLPVGLPPTVPPVENPLVNDILHSFLQAPDRSYQTRIYAINMLIAGLRTQTITTESTITTLFSLLSDQFLYELKPHLPSQEHDALYDTLQHLFYYKADDGSYTYFFPFRTFVLSILLEISKYKLVPLNTADQQNIRNRLTRYTKEYMQASRYLPPHDPTNTPKVSEKQLSHLCGILNNKISKYKQRSPHSFLEKLSLTSEFFLNTAWATTGLIAAYCIFATYQHDKFGMLIKSLQRICATIERKAHTL